MVSKYFAIAKRAPLGDLDARVVHVPVHRTPVVVAASCNYHSYYHYSVSDCAATPVLTSRACPANRHRKISQVELTPVKLNKVTY